jgi:hypothetical protein
MMKLARLLTTTLWVAAILVFFATVPQNAAAQSGGATAKTVITVMPKHAEQAPEIQANDLKIKVNGKTSEVDSITPLRGEHAGLELVILIDSGVRNSLGRQMSEIADFIRSLPPTTEIGIAYMINGRSVFQQPFTTDKAAALKALHLPGGTPGSSASPYFCLSELAKNWPSTNTQNRREVVAITDGIDPYEVRFDPEDPYVRQATDDSIRAGVVVNAIYWHDMGIASRIEPLVNGGQSLLTLITDNTGGTLYYQGLSNPVSFLPFFRDLNKRLENQYELGFMVPEKVKPGIATLQVKLTLPDAKADSPKLVSVQAQ